MWAQVVTRHHLFTRRSACLNRRLQKPHNTSIIRQCRRYYDLVSNIRHSAKLEASRKMESLVVDVQFNFKFYNLLCVLVNVCVCTHNLFHNFKLMCHCLTRQHDTDNSTGQFTVEFCCQIVFSKFWIIQTGRRIISQLDLQKCPDFKTFWILFLSRQEKKLLLEYVNSYLRICVYFKNVIDDLSSSLSM
jgi:hypothetical protein